MIAATRKQFEQQLSQKDEDIAKREQGTRDKEKPFDARRALSMIKSPTQVAAVNPSERTRVIEEESKKAKLAAAT
ncbi:MAG: hypothetical protein IPL72_07715 [Sulfuritalea sp.]|nr:hypothetical protein [Sulfuritalea sp.]